MIISYIKYIEDFKRLLKYTNYFNILKIFIIDMIFNNSIVKNYYKNNLVEIRINSPKLLYHKKKISNVIAMISEEEYFNFIKKQIYNVVIDIGAYAGLFSF